MSIQLYSCDCCGKTVDEEHVCDCTKCGKDICINCVVGEGDFFDDMKNDYGLKKEHCPFCNSK
jgi:hypothetical protein